MPTIRKRGNAYQAIVRLTIRGTSHTETRSFPSEKLASDWAQRLEVKLKDEGIPQRQLATQTLGELIEQYEQTLMAVQPVRRTMQHEYAALAQAFANDKLADLTPETFTKYATRKQQDNGTGPATILHNLSTVRSVLNAARPMYGLQVDGTSVAQAITALGRIGVVAKSQSRTRRPTQDELDRIRQEFQRAAAYPSTVIPMATVIDMAVALPRRLGELMDMQWGNYDKKARTIKLLDTKHPNKPRDEVVPVPPAAARIIDTLPVIDACMLPYKSESASAAFQRCCNRLGIADLHFHDLRHDGISRLFEQGLDVHEVAMISGHLSWTALRRYTHLKPEQVLRKLK